MCRKETFSFPYPPAGLWFMCRGMRTHQCGALHLDCRRTKQNIYLNRFRKAFKTYWSGGINVFRYIPSATQSVYIRWLLGEEGWNIETMMGLRTCPHVLELIGSPANDANRHRYLYCYQGSKPKKICCCNQGIRLYIARRQLGNCVASKCH